MSDSLALFENRLKHVFENPSFLGSPLLTVLDELQVALCASRLDARIVDPEKGSYVISSAAKREWNEDTRKWQLLQEDSDQESNWSLEVASDVLVAPAKIRTALRTSKHTLRVEFKKPFRFKERDNDSTLVEIILWIPDALAGLARTGQTFGSSDDDIQHLLCCMNASLEITRGAVAQLDPLGYDAFKSLEDNDSRTFLAKVFEWLDSWLKGLLTTRTDLDKRKKQLSKYLFLNQFFWVMSSRTADFGSAACPAPTAGLATVMPVFLEQQRDHLKRLFQQPRTFGMTWSWKEASEEISNIRLDSRSLFSAFPADTGLSLYVEDWPGEIVKALPMDPNLSPSQLERFNLFRELTEKAHKSAGREVGLQEGDKLDLFAVPVLVGRDPLFVVTMSLPVRLAARERAELAAHIRALGGMMRSHEQVYEMARCSREREEENSFERKQSVMSRNVLIDRSVSQLVGPIPSTIVNPLRSTLEEAERTQSNKVQVPLNVVREVIQSCEQVLDRAARISERFCGGSKEPIDVIEALHTAIAAIPKSSRPRLHLDYDPVSSWRTLGIRDALTTALSQIIFTASKACAENDPFYIRVRKRLEDPFLAGDVRLEFLENRKAGNRVPFESIANSNEAFSDAHFEVIKANGVIEFDTTVREDEHIFDACCVVKLPIIP